MAKKEKKGIIAEFKEFALQGNLFDMATGVLIGGVFKDLVSSFTDNVIMPMISIFTGGLDFSQWKLALPSLFEKVDPETGKKIIPYLNYGNFISSVISFFILAIVIFLMIKGMNTLRAKARKAKEAEEKKEEAAPPEPSAEEKLLTEIRDLLAKK